MEWTALHVAVDMVIIHRGNLEVARLLIQHGENVSAQASGGTMPLHVVVNHWSCETMMRLLLQNGTDVEANDETTRAFVGCLVSWSLLSDTASEYIRVGINPPLK